MELREWKMFRKRPVVVAAFQMTKERRLDNSDWPEWLNAAWNEDRSVNGSLSPNVRGTGDGVLRIMTSEGPQTVSWDDWIIQGVRGEIYPCKPDIFEETYEPVKEAGAIRDAR